MQNWILYSFSIDICPLRGLFSIVAKDSLEEWSYFLKNNQIKDTFKAPGLAEAKERHRRHNPNSAGKEAYNHFVKAKRINQNVFETAVLEWILEIE